MHGTEERKGEPMSDLISRQAAIEAFEKKFISKDYSIIALTFDGCKKVIENLPAAEPRWIPVTERLPEDGRYLCTYQNGEGVCVDFGLFANGEWFVEPVAYMPLPEPWKGESDG